ncbi:MAG: potassium-transporting ATPase subunit A [Bdellovibrionales bacterium RIFOXYA1_FULL_36_14]|nr:MAG: potassium-transporting ATPase subunit A [Bdellovibrionales bacterium RIFOXYA1_FULL_36_14]
MKIDVLILWLVYFLILSGTGLILGKMLAHIFKEKGIGLEEKFLKLIGIDATTSMNWKEYLSAVLIFNLIGLILLQLILMTQQWHPFNPEARSGLSFWMAFNIATSFVTNTNWQNYGGEATLSYFSQMLGLTVQNFLSASTGVAVLVVFIRSLVKKEVTLLGNFWSDLTRFTVRILLPLSFVFALFLISQGVPQTLKGSVSVQTLEGKDLKVPVGPVASQIAIKMNGSNGGGFFNVNAAHPYENPTPVSNFVQLISILLLPVSCVFMLIFMLPRKQEGYPILGVMTVLLLLGVVLSYWAQVQINPITHMVYGEGVDTRFSLSECSLWSVATTAVSNGSVNCMHSSMSPLAQLVALFNMMTGEVIFGGVGSGLYGMLLYVLMTVFLAGLMVGRTPEYLGKKIESKEVIWASFALLAPGLFNLLFSAWALHYHLGLASLSHSGPHGLSEVLYAFTSAFGNNGSAFAGLNANSTFYNITTGFAMLFGRFAVIVSVLIIAGSLGPKKKSPIGPGSLKTDTSLFAVLLFSVILILGALTFFPVLVLGPVAEHLILDIF